jgi:hypothetical protein
MVDTPGTGVAHGSLHSEDAPLPLSVEHRFVLFDLDFAEAVHTAHVVHAVHQRIIPHAFVGASAMSALPAETWGNRPALLWIAIENDLRGTLRNFGLEVGIVGWTRFEARIEELVEDVTGAGKCAPHSLRNLAPAGLVA